MFVSPVSSIELSLTQFVGFVIFQRHFYAFKEGLAPSSAVNKFQDTTLLLATYRTFSTVFLKKFPVHLS